MAALRFIPKLVLATLCMAALPGAQGRTNNLEDRLLAAHNRERDTMDVAPLVWDENLARGAQEWADYLSETGRFEHSPNVRGEPREGENIWGGTPEYFSPESMVGLWIEEKRHFRYGQFPFNSTTGDVADVSHYTQVIWQRTGKVGCGLSNLGDEEILVCRYSRPGNVIGGHPLS